MENKVFWIKDQHGNVCNEGTPIQDAFLDYYQDLLCGHNSTNPVNARIVKRSRCCTEEHWQILNRGVTTEEVRQCLFSIPKDKSPGPDGFTSQFYRDAWAIVGEDVLSLVLPDIISRNQGAFIQCRSILENILVCQDLVRMYNRGNASLRCMFKIDLQKAYDSLEWSFLDQMLDVLNFSEKFRKLIFVCVTSTTFSLNLISAMYHPMCGALKLNHLLFADDLLMFSKGDVKSIIGVTDGIRSDILQIYGFKEGLYLLDIWVFPSRPTSGMEVLTIRGHQWWPCIRFVAAKKEGGLGIKDAEKWNIAIVGKLVDWIYRNADRLWVLWIDHVYLKGRDWNTYVPPRDSNWNWRNIYKVRGWLSTGDPCAFVWGLSVCNKDHGTNTRLVAVQHELSDCKLV
ncbi:uncharacterized protein LOC141651667 [Silene latifolia]|uniref:uncharacterized protein LOC141651667 n=1 Tax=Silene latifolia TaxID=37657 RepID=UPI003D788F5A